LIIDQNNLIAGLLQNASAGAQKAQTVPKAKKVQSEPKKAQKK